MFKRRLGTDMRKKGQHKKNVFPKNSWNKFICFAKLLQLLWQSCSWVNENNKNNKNSCMVKGEHDVILFFSVNVIIAKKIKKNSKEFKININKNTTKT